MAEAPESPSPSNQVRVRVFEFEDQAARPIGRARVASDLLQNRKEDITAAIADAADIVQHAADSAQRHERLDAPWALKTVEAKFGLALGLEAGVLISKTSAEASLEVTLTWQRNIEPRTSHEHDA